MNGLLLNAKEQRFPIEIMYLSSGGDISFRTVIVKDIQEDHLHVHCLAKNKPRIFKKSNILSVAKPRYRKEAGHA